MNCQTCGSPDHTLHDCPNAVLLPEKRDACAAWIAVIFAGEIVIGLILWWVFR